MDFPLRHALFPVGFAGWHLLRGAEFEGSVDKYTYNVGGQTSISGVAYVQPQETNTVSLAFPGIGGGAMTGVFGGNVVVAEVPEPEFTTLLAIGLASLALFGRKIRDLISVQNPTF